MQRYLSRDFHQVIRWDYPRIFSDLDAVANSLAGLLDSSEAPTSIVAHSFGDWIVRSALHHTRRTKFDRLVSVCPVTTAVPIVKWIRPLSANLVSEFAVMEDAERASLSIPDRIEIQRSLIVATGEFIVRESLLAGSNPTPRRVAATHNSILFQPNGWRAIRHELRRPSKDLDFLVDR